MNDKAYSKEAARLFYSRANFQKMGFFPHVKPKIPLFMVILFKNMRIN